MDEIADTEEWKTEFLKPEAAEVVQAVGAWICCLVVDTKGDVESVNGNILRAVQEVVEEHVGYGAEVTMLAIAGPSRDNGPSISDNEKDGWEDVCIQHGFELVDYGAQGRNEYGERQGRERVREALETNDWDQADNENDNGDFDDLGLEDDLRDYNIDEVGMTAELFDLKAALADEEEEPMPASKQKSAVNDLDSVVSRLLAVREQSADLPEAQRKRMAAKAVRELLQEP